MTFEKKFFGYRTRMLTKNSAKKSHLSFGIFNEKMLIHFYEKKLYKKRFID